MVAPSLCALGLTAAPTLCTEPARSFGRFTKLYTYLLILVVFAQHASAVQRNVEDDRRYDERLLREYIHWNQTGSNGDHTARSDDRSSQSKVASRKELYQGADVGRAAMPTNGKRTHVDLMIEGIAQELFFVDNELNFHAAHSLDWFKDWAHKHNSEFLQQRSARKKLAVDTFFMEKFLGALDFHCDQDGCSNYPSDHDIKGRNDRHEARHLLNMIRSFEKANAEVRQYIALLQEVKEEVSRLCEDFSITFFHGETKGHKKMCPAEIIEITFIVLVALITLGVAWEVTAPAAMTLTAQIVGLHTAEIATGAMGFGSFASRAFMAKLVQPLQIFNPFTRGGYNYVLREMMPHLMKNPYTGRPYGRPGRRSLEADHDLTDEEKDAMAVFNKFIEDALSKVHPVPRQNVKSDGTTENPEYGGFGLLEYFNSTELNDDESSVYDQAKMVSGWGFLRYPSPFAEPHVPEQDASSTIRIPSLQDQSVHRLTRLFDVTSSSQKESLGSGSNDEFVDILRRLVHEDESAMSLGEVLGFFENHVQNITARSQELRGSIAEFPSKYLPVHGKDFNPHVKISSVNQDFPWTTLLSGLKFDGQLGAPDVKNASAKFQWRTNSGGTSSGSQKRDSQSGSSGHIKHEIAGMLRSLEAINVLDSPNGNGKAKRGTRNWNIEKRQDKDGDVFVADVSEQYFKNEIKHQKCGLDNYTGDKEKNKRACEAYVNNVIQSIAQRMSKAYTDANYDSPIAMAAYLQNKFSTYSTWRNADRIYVPAVKTKVKKNLQNSLVSKAYADGNCFVRCGNAPGYKVDLSGPSVHYAHDMSCQTGCYDPIKKRYERLYGFDGRLKTSQGHAANEPWNLDEKVINKVSVNAHGAGLMSIHPGVVNLDPYTPLDKDLSPVLPVCYSRLGFQHQLVCNCGNEYGDETSKFAQFVNLRAEGKRNEWKAIDSCLEQIDSLAYNHPAAYLLNACNIVYHIVAPMGSGSAQEKHDLGHYKHNFGACKVYWDFYKKNQHLNDGDLNKRICTLWAEHAKDFDRGLNHKHPDFSYVNDKLEDHGCWGYLDR